MIRVLIVDDVPTTRANIERAFAAHPEIEVVAFAESADAALNQASVLLPDVALIDIDLHGGQGLLTTQRMVQASPATAIIVMGLDDDEATNSMVQDAGAMHYLVKPFSGEELAAAINEVAQPGPAEASAAPLAQPPPRPAIAPPPPMPEFVAPQAVDRAPGFPVHTVAVISGKGGAGVTMLATSLALIASAEGRRRTALVDLDLQHGDIRRLLRIDSRESVIELAQASPVPDEGDLMRRFADGPGGILALTAPARPRIDVELTPEFAVALVQALRTASDFAAIDLPSYITPASAAVLRNADRVILVSSMSDPGVRSTQGMLSLFGELGIARDRIALVLNRNEANSDLTKAGVEEELGMESTVQLPYDFVLVSTAVNHGVPFVLQRPDAQVSRKIRELGATLFPLALTPELAPDLPPAYVLPPVPNEPAPSRGRRKSKSRFGFGRGEDDR